MSDEPFTSHAQNREDVVLWRALGHVTHGVYVDVGGWDPDVDSVTRAFYDRGWCGVDVEPVPEFAAKFRERRPRNDVVQAVITDADVDRMVLHRFGTTGLSTIDDEVAERHDKAGFEREDISVPALRLDDVLTRTSLVGESVHFLKVDVEGAEEQVLRSVDLVRWRPWVLVIEATEPNSTTATHESWEPLVLEAGYTFTLFDGLSRFYVSADHPELLSTLSYPACALDRYEPAPQVELRAALAACERELEVARNPDNHWRNVAVSYWANAVAKAQTSEEAAKQARSEADRAHDQLDRLRVKLQQIRADRTRLRARVRRLATRIERMEARQHDASHPIRRRLRGAVKKATGA